MLSERAPHDIEWTSFKERLCAKATQEKEIKLVGYNLSFRACMFRGRGEKVPISCVIEVFWVFAYLGHSELTRFLLKDIMRLKTCTWLS